MKVKTTAENRKDVVKAMEEILNVKAKYQGPPSFGYKVGEYTVDRDGNVEHESEEAALTMQNELVARGLAEGEADRLNIGIPIEGFTAEGIKNLIYMIHSKQYLLEKAVGKEVFRISDKLVERLDAEENIPLTVPSVPIGGACISSIRSRTTRHPLGYSFRTFSTSSLLGNLMLLIIISDLLQ